MQEEVALSGNTVEDKADDPQAIFKLAVKEVKQCLRVTKDSLPKICGEIENASSKAIIRPVFRRLNSVTQIFLRLAPEDRYRDLISKALCELEASPRLQSFLPSAGSVQEAIRGYKSSVLRDLAAIITRDQECKRIDDERDDELFSLILPEPSSPEPEVEELTRKRAVSDVDDLLVRIPKRSKIPALAPLHMVPGGGADGQSAKKNVLVTRQKLRAAQLDPRGLLNLVSVSSNALERAKQLEMRKTAGLLQKNNRKRSFADRLQEAKVRVDLGLAGQEAGDTLLFGQKVMSAPGFLSAKNITDIQNNNVEGTTTWKHQNAYCKMIIAGCLNQARSIVKKFDTVLHGAKPETLIEETHKGIRDVLRSPEGRDFFREMDRTEAARTKACDKVVMKIVEAVAPIVPLTLRDKALDSGYLRTALHFLGAAEFMLARYETDVRTQANPNGVVGLAAAMHDEFDRSVVFNDPLKPVEEFMSCMKSQYQTSLGLGAPFPKDFGGRARQRDNRRDYRRGRGGAFYPRRSLSNLGSGRGLPGGQGQFVAEQDTRAIPIRGRGACYDFQQGRCRRGITCRFSHVNQ